ncbi:MAG: S-layer homology domain-containing protein [Candidatus Sericytochromatia bacterium]|nr:S-layer homology domain-containing protein [Candidatus Sericytochromatia bacterium]
MRQPYCRTLASSISACLSLLLLAPAAAAYTPMSELKDVASDHWAREAIRALAEKYEVMDGFPDKTFRGARTLTRYELAAALAKVMARVEAQIANSTGRLDGPDLGANPEDLRTIARLQREFRDELEVLKNKAENLENRTKTLEQRVRVGGEMRNEYRTFRGSMPAAQAPVGDLRVRNKVDLEAALTDDTRVRSALYWDVYGTPSAGLAFGAPQVGAAGTPWTETYLAKAYVSHTPGSWAFHAGVMNARDALTLGSAFKNPFTQNLWREGLGGYGFVGTPGFRAGETTSPARMRTGDSTDASNPVWWLPGTDVVGQALDPNTTQPIAPRGNYTVAAGTQAGPFQFGIAWYQGGISGRDLSRLGQLAYADSLPQAETFNPGGRLLATLGADFGVVRAQVAAKTIGLPTDAPDTLNKTLTGTIDVGSDALGLTFQTVSRTALTGNFNPTQASLTLASNNLLGTGFGFGLGLNSGSVITLSGDTNQSFAASGRSLLQGLAGTDYNSYGLALKIPGFSVFPHWTLALQQTAGANFSGTLGSGLSVQTELKIDKLPALQLEYSSGKFTPGADNGLLNNATAASHELLSAQMLLPF